MHGDSIVHIRSGLTTMGVVVPTGSTDPETIPVASVPSDHKPETGENSFDDLVTGLFPAVGTSGECPDGVFQARYRSNFGKSPALGRGDKAKRELPVDASSVSTKKGPISWMGRDDSGTG